MVLKGETRANRRGLRSQSGSLLVLIVCVLAIVFALVMVPGFNLLKVVLTKQSQSTAIEAAALAAATDLSRIVIEDPHFGFIALSDAPPIGLATRAVDGEPLPVTGINTIIGTCRLEMLIACELDNLTMKQMALQDTKAARQAAASLSSALAASLDQKSDFVAKDLDGNVVKPYESAKRLLASNQHRGTMLGAPSSKSLKLTLGWLKSGGYSQTAIPQPACLAQIPPGLHGAESYPAFVDIPVADESYYFAGLSQQPSLVDETQFQIADGMRPSSIVRAEVELEFAHGRANSSGLQNATMRMSACAQPSAAYDVNPAGAMVISFPNGLIPELTNIESLLADRRLGAKALQIYTAEKGDFPDDQYASLTTNSPSSVVATVQELFARGLYDWIRTAHCKPRIDSLLEALERPFDDNTVLRTGSPTRPYLIYEFDREGRVVVCNQKCSPFGQQTVQENQSYALGFNAITIGAFAWTLSFRDQVHELGIHTGGKHGGQTLPGNPINWCELAAFNSSPEIAAQKGKGSKWLRMNVSGSPAANMDRDSIATQTAHFSRDTGGAAIAQPRKSYLSGGMAVEFVLSSPTMAKL